MSLPTTHFVSLMADAVDRIMSNSPLAESTIADALMAANDTRQELMTAIELAYQIVNAPSQNEWRAFRGMLGVVIRRGVEEYVADHLRRSISY